MDILGLMAVLSFGLTCFGIGYSFGKDNSNTKKQPHLSDELSGYFDNLVGLLATSHPGLRYLLPADTSVFYYNVSN